MESLESQLEPAVLYSMLKPKSPECKNDFPSQSPIFCFHLSIQIDCRLILDLTQILVFKVHGYSKLKILYEHCRGWGYDIPSVPEEDLKTIVEMISPGELVRFFIDILEQNSEDRVVEVFMAFMASKKPRAPIKLNGWKDVHQDWTKPYSNVSLQALTDSISRFERSNAPGERFYARTIALVQSSGMGKSRLIAEFGKRYPSINFCLRTGRDGYPPPDSDVLTSLLAPIPKKVISTQALAKETIKRKRGLFMMWAHALAAAHLQALFDYCR